MDPRSPRRVTRPPSLAGTLAAMNTRSRFPAARVAAFITVMAAAALLAAACGGSPSSSASGGSPTAAPSATSVLALAYSRCMRSHGMPNFPDPDSSGQLSKQAIISASREVSDSVNQAAQRACDSLWPYQAPTQAQLEQQLAADVRFVQCVRSHGVPNLPDPIISNGRVEVVISSSAGIDVGSPRIQAIASECQHVLPPGTPRPAATLAP
jgi:hypothetical protein